MSDRLSRRLLLIAWLVGWAIVLPAELARPASPEGMVGTDPPLSLIIPVWDTTPWLVLLTLAPVCWAWRGAFWQERPAWFDRLVSSFAPAESKSTSEATPSPPRPLLTFVLAAVVAATSLAASAEVALRPVDREGQEPFGSLPPAYHDEFSYLFQAETFLAGRASFPSHPEAPELFDQVHVLNEGRFASRYFPGTGAWMAPFLAMGDPHLGHWIAGALASVAIFFAGCELGGRGTGFVAGMLTAVSPGIALFGNLLLAHQPTLFGLSLFLAAFLRLMRRPAIITALVAGTGLSFAMLCRPMTAAGFALPAGLWMAGWMVLRVVRMRDGSAAPAEAGRALLVGAALAAPLVAGFAVIFVHDRAITGDGLKTPYGLYTEIYTPRHGYGFNNVLRGEQHLGPKVLENYDRWARNLTPLLAARNVANRLVASLEWTLGIVPLVMAAVLVIGGPLRHERRWGLILASIVSLHAAHVPYWFDGIMHWHYVFESAPLWPLLYAGATAAIVRTASQEMRPGLAAWWILGGTAALGTAWFALNPFQLFLASTVVTGLLLAAAMTGRLAAPRRTCGVAALITVALLFVSLLAPDPLWPIGRLDVGVIEVGFSRLRYARFRRLIEEWVTDRPAVVLVVADPADRHIDYVTNGPALDAPVLIARQTRDDDAERVRRLFPKRQLYVFDARRGTLSPRR